MSDGHTIIASHLDDKELRASIDNLVEYYKGQLKTMRDSTTESVRAIHDSLKELEQKGKGKSGSTSSSDAGSSARAKKQQEEVAAAVEKTTEAYKKQNATLDQQAQGFQKVARASSSQGSFLEHIKSQNEQLQKWLTFPQSSSFGIINIKAIEKDLRESEPRIREEIERVKKELEAIQKLPFRGGPYGLIQTKRLTAELQEYEAALSRISTEEKKATSIEEQRAAAIKKMADEIRNSKEWKETGYAWVDGHQYIDATRGAGRTKREREALGSLEEQIARHMRDQAYAAERAARAEREEAEEAKKNRDFQRETTAEFQKRIYIAPQAKVVDNRRSYDAPQVKGVDDEATFRKMVRTALGGKSSYNVFSLYSAPIEKLQIDFKSLTDAYARLNRVARESPFGKELLDRIAELRLRIKELNQEASKPLALKKIFEMPENSISQISTKVSELRANLNMLDQSTEKGREEARSVQDAITRLMKKQDDLMGKQKQLFGSNHALARSWNYMKNRLAFYFSVGASTQFVRNLIEVRSQYELTERSLGILINSAERGTQIFQELSQMALVSPYTLIELSTAAKQLAAYDIAARDVVDTTRRLADISAAVGVPVERFTYALGQVKAFGHLTSQDARQFLNTGVPLVRELAEYYTVLEGRLVSTADVYDRMKKHAVSYNDVVLVLNRMTDEGGKFFDFQAKMAETLKVKLANLTLAWNNMLNDIGKESQGVLNWGIGALRELFLHWKQFDSLLKNAAWALGIRTGFMLIDWVALKAGAALGVTSRQMALSSVFGTRLAGVLKNVALSMKTIVTSPLTWWSLLAIAAVEATQAIFGVNEAQKALNESIRNGAKDNYDNISKFLEQYKEVRNSLYSTQNYNPTTKKADATAYAGQQFGQDIDQNEAKKAWEAIREQIEITVASSDKYIEKLLSISNMSERVRQGFNLLEDVQVVNAALKELDDNTIKVSKDFSAWWNLGLAPEGLIENLKDYQDALDDIIEKYGSVESMKEQTFLGGKGGHDRNNYETALERFRNDLQKTTDSVLDFINLKGWSNDESKINQVFEQISQKLVLDNQLDPQKAFTLQTEVEEARSEAAKRALLQRINDEKEAYKISHDESIRQAINADVERYNSWDETNGRSKVEWERFTKWLKEQHISETTAMFRNMEAEDIRSLNFQEGKHAEWVTRMVTQYAKEHKMSYDEAFKYLRSWVRSANQWSIFIPLTISNKDKKSVYEQLGEYDKAVDEADAQIERLTTRIGELNAKKKKSKEETQELVDAENQLAQAQKDKAEAEAKGGHGKKEKKDERAANKAANKSARQEESALTKALREQLSIIEQAENIYKSLIKDGRSHADAVKVASEGWDKSLRAINAILKRNGLPKMDMSEFVGLDNPKALKDKLQAQLDVLVKRGAKPAEIKVMEDKIKDLDVEEQKFNLSKLTKSLNSELDKLKDEYELSLALDADPELGGVFAEMLKIDTKALPKDFGELVSMMNDAIRKALVKDNVVADAFDVMTADIKGDDKGLWKGLSLDSELVRGIIKAQDWLRSTFQKNITSTEKALDDYVKKYGDYSDRIAEIEANRLQRMRDLNNAYYGDEMRRSPEYIAKARAIETGAAREKGAVRFDAFKDSPYYIAMFENLEYLSSSTLKSIRQRLSDIRSELGSLTPEQLKQIVEMSEKVDEQIAKKNPFSNFTKNFKEYIKALKTKKKVDKDLATAQDTYKQEADKLVQLKTQLEQAKDAGDKYSMSIFQWLIGLQQKVVDTSKESLENAQKASQAIKGTLKSFANQLSSISNTFSNISNAVNSIRDDLSDLGVDLGEQMNGIIDGFSQASEGLSDMVQSAMSGDIFGVVAGGIHSLIGQGKMLVSLFGGRLSPSDYITPLITKLQGLMDTLDAVNEKQAKYLDSLAGPAAVAKYRELIKNNDKQIENYRRLAKAAGESGASVGSHSWASRSNKRLKGQWEEISKYAGATLRSVQDMYSLDASQLEAIMINAPEQWSKIDADIRSYFEKIIEYGEKAEEYTKKLGEALTSITSESVASDFENMLRDMTSSTADFADNVEEMLRNAIIRSMMANTYNKKLEDWYNLFTAALGDGELSDTEARDLHDEYMKIVNSALKDREELMKAVPDSASSLSALQQGIQGITEDTAGALEAITSGMYQQVYYQSTLLEQIKDSVAAMDFDVNLGVMSQILLQLQTSYQTQQAIQSILEGWTNASGMAVRVEMV